MKKYIAICCLCLGNILFAGNHFEEESPIVNRYGYVTLGVGPLPFPVPTLGGGFRTQNDHHGIDMNASGVVVAAERVALKLAGRLLYYFNPNETRQYYAGIGPSVSPVFSSYNCSSWAGLGIASEFLIGREHLSCSGNKRFWEIVVDFPTISISGNGYKKEDQTVIYFPYAYVQYGWGF